MTAGFRIDWNGQIFVLAGAYASFGEKRSLLDMKRGACAKQAYVGDECWKDFDQSSKRAGWVILRG